MKDFDKILDEMFEEWCLANPDKPQPSKGQPMCLQPNDGYKCTCAVNHAGDHAAHGRLGGIFKQWSNK